MRTYKIYTLVLLAISWCFDGFPQAPLVARGVRMLFPAAAEATIPAASRGFIRSSVGITELGVLESSQHGILQISKTQLGELVITNVHGETISYELLWGEISTQMMNKDILPQIGYKNVKELQREFGLSATGELNPETKNLIGMLVDMVNKSTLLYGQNYPSEITHDFLLSRARPGQSQGIALNELREYLRYKKILETNPKLTELEKFYVKNKLKLSIGVDPLNKRVPDIVPESVTSKEATAKTVDKRLTISRQEVKDIQSYLKLRNYYTGEIDGLWGNATEQSSRKFFASTYSSSSFDAGTFITAVQKEETNTTIHFGLLGYNTGLWNGNKLNSEAIRKYQEFKGLPVTGILDEKTINVANEEVQYSVEMMRVVNADVSTLKYTVDHKRLLDYRSPIASFQKINGDHYFLIENKSYGKPKLEIWTSKSGAYPTRVPEPEIYKKIIDATSAMFMQHQSSNVHYISVIPNKTENKAYLLVDGNQLEVDEQAIVDDLDGVLKKVDELFIEPTSDEKPKYIVNLSLFDNAHRRIDDEEFTSVSDFHFTNEDLYLYLNEKHGNAYEFYIAEDLISGMGNLRDLPQIQKPEDLRIAYSRGAVDDDKIVMSLVDNHEPFFFSKGLMPIENSNIVLVTGHKDQNLLQFLRNHGEKGNLKNKVVAVFSCFDHADAGFYADLMKKYGIKEIIYFPYELKASSVEILLDEILVSVKKEKSPIFFSEVIQKSVQSILKKNEIDVNQSELRRMLYPIKKLSKVFRKGYVKIMIA